MITFYFENGCVATLRTSGTEPKIKYYTELACKPGDGYVFMFHLFLCARGAMCTAFTEGFSKRKDLTNN